MNPLYYVFPWPFRLLKKIRMPNFSTFFWSEICFTVGVIFILHMCDYYVFVFLLFQLPLMFILKSLDRYPVSPHPQIFLVQFLPIHIWKLRNLWSSRMISVSQVWQLDILGISPPWILQPALPKLRNTVIVSKQHHLVFLPYLPCW